MPSEACGGGGSVEPAVVTHREEALDVQDTGPPDPTLKQSMFEPSLLPNLDRSAPYWESFGQLGSCGALGDHRLHHPLSLLTGDVVHSSDDRIRPPREGQNHDEERLKDNVA
jgi:hypothetical protein